MENKKYYIFFTGFLVLLIIIYLILSINNSNESKKANTLKDDKTYFILENIINNYNQNDNYMINQTIIDKVYYKENDLQTTYFVNAYKIYSGFSDNLSFEDNLKYQITIKGIGYKVEQINTNNLEEYTINYELSDITTDDIIPSLTYNEQDKLVYYLSVFKNLLKASPIKAYDYLSDKQQNKYNSYNHFLNSISNIDRDINTKITSYQKNNNTYIIYTQNKQITLIENELMDFKIEY